MKQNSWAQKDYNSVFNLKNSGVCAWKISKTLKIPSNTVYRWLRNENQPRSITQRWFKQIPIIFDKNSGFIFGAVYGDGYYQLNKKGGYLLLGSKDFDLIQEIDKCLEEWTKYRGTISFKKDNYFILTFCSRKLVEFIKETSFENIKLTSLEFKRYFLRGIFDTDGGISIDKKGNGRLYFYNTNSQIIELVKKLLSDFNIKVSGIHSFKQKPSFLKSGKIIIPKKDIYHLIISTFENIKKFYNEIGFSIQRKQEKLKEYVSNPSFLLIRRENIKNFVKESGIGSITKEKLIELGYSKNTDKSEIINYNYIRENW